MSIIRLTDAELARDVHAVLEKVQEGVEIILEQGQRPVAIIKASTTAGRMLSEVRADLRARSSTAVIDDDFARDIEAGIRANRQPWKPLHW